MLDVKNINDNFTWDNRRVGFSHIAEKLDRFLFKGHLGEFNYSLESETLNLFGSDHFLVT